MLKLAHCAVKLLKRWLKLKNCEISVSCQTVMVAAQGCCKQYESIREAVKRRNASEGASEAEAQARGDRRRSGKKQRGRKDAEAIRARVQG